METVTTGALRRRICQLRHDLAVTAESYRMAKSQGETNQVITLLRRKSTLIRQLFETQSALLLAFRSKPDGESDLDHTDPRTATATTSTPAGNGNTVNSVASERRTA